MVLTAGLFVLVEALDAAGAAGLPRALFAWAAHAAGTGRRSSASRFAAAAASNAVNNLPVGLDSASTSAPRTRRRRSNAAALIGVNVGPNFSANGSLATVLWLADPAPRGRRRLAAEVRRGRPGNDTIGADRGSLLAR